jgi:hypothetical protein
MSGCKQAIVIGALVCAVCSVSRICSAQLQAPSWWDDYGYEFDDESTKAVRADPTAIRVTCRRSPWVIRPRISFVPELLASVERR